METKQKILIVDDSAMNRQILSEVLGSDYDYLFAGDGLQALELLSQIPTSGWCCWISACPSWTASAC